MGGSSENSYSEPVILSDLTKYLLNESFHLISSPQSEKLSSLTWWIDREAPENYHSILSSANWAELFRRFIIQREQYKELELHPEIDTTQSNDIWKIDPLLKADPYLPDDDPLYQCLISLIQLMSHPDSLSFLEPVEIDGYYDVIKKPIDLTMIGNKLISAWYTPIICTENYKSLNELNNIKIDELYHDDDNKEHNDLGMEEEMEGEASDQEANIEQNPHIIDDNIENKLDISLRKIPKKTKDFGEQFGMRYIHTNGGIKYGGVSSFACDIRLIWQNCRKFNNKETSVYRLAQKLQTLFEKYTQIINMSIDMHRNKYGDKPIHGHKLYHLAVNLNKEYIYHEPENYLEMKKQFLSQEYGGENIDSSKIPNINDIISCLSFFDYSTISAKYKMGCMEYVLQYMLNHPTLANALNSQQEHFDKCARSKENLTDPISQKIFDIKNKRHEKEHELKGFLKYNHNVDSILLIYFRFISRFKRKI